MKVLIKSTILICSFLFISNFKAQAQKKPKKEIKEETEVNENKPIQKLEIDFENAIPSYEVAMLGSKGVILMTHEKRVFNLTRYNSDLKKTYSVDLDIEKGQNYLTYIHRDKKIYLLFADAFGTSESYVTSQVFKKFSLVEFDLESKKQKAVSGKFEKPFSLTQMEEVNGKVYLMGSTTISSVSKFGRSCYSIALCYIPTLFGSLNYPGWANMASIDFSKQEAICELIDSYGKKPHIKMLAANINSEKNVANVLVKDSKSKKETHLYLQSIILGNQNKPSDPIEMSVGDNFEAFTAKVNYTGENDRLVVGCFGDKVRKTITGGDRFAYTKGIYISKLDKNKVLWNKNILYTQIFNSENSKSKDISKNEKNSRSQIQVLFHNVIESEEQYIFIGETYYPTFHTETRTSYSNGKWTTYTVTIFDGFVYDKCIAFATDKKGTFQWSSIFYLPYYRTYNPTKERVNVNTLGDKIAVSTFSGSNLVTYFLDEEGFTEESTNTQIKTSKADDKIRSSHTNVDIWYDNYYIAYGDMTIKAKKKDENGKKKRQYIYFYKMQVGEEFKEESDDEE